jgi:hypothetical protein
VAIAEKVEVGPARSLCEGFGFQSFDVELARYRGEISQAKAAAKKRPR